VTALLIVCAGGCVPARSGRATASFASEREIDKAYAALRMQPVLRQLFETRETSGHSGPPCIAEVSPGCYEVGSWRIDVRRRTYELPRWFMHYDAEKQAWCTETYRGTFAVSSDGQWSASKPRVETIAIDLDTGSRLPTDRSTGRANARR